MNSLFDQSALAAIAERLVEAARRAGADAADAVAVRGMSQSVSVRDGVVEESQRSEGDDMGLRVFVGRRQAVVSTNDIFGEDIEALAGRAVAMARAAPEDGFAGLADPHLLATVTPDLDLFDPAIPSVGDLETMARTAEAAALAVNGVTKSSGASASAGIGGMVLVTSGGFRGAYLGSRHGVSVEAIAGEGTAMESDHDFSSARHTADLEAAETIGRRAGERAVKRLNPRKVSTRRVPVIYDFPGRRLADRASRRCHQRRGHRPQDKLSAGPLGEQVFAKISQSSMIRCGAAACVRSPSTPKASRQERRRWSRTAS